MTRSTNDQCTCPPCCCDTGGPVCRASGCPLCALLDDPVPYRLTERGEQAVTDDPGRETA
ncbi:hypothetical protein [Nocardiopsis rhodophaea]|uniref:hypothetical protein n=1 Tax=Nocardiopsis rhodophaea TaxID=280238 RepID=UPI0031DBAF8C